jgi:O-antigen biosynthesis protein
MSEAVKYRMEIDLNNLNDSHALVIQEVPDGSRVLELGAAYGDTTAVLSSRGCQVTAVDLDPEAVANLSTVAFRAAVVNLDDPDWSSGLEIEGGYDVIIAADLLEHLRDAEGVLNACRPLLAAQGRIIVSIPNVAHGDVRLALLRGEFRYQPSGLLDQTHVRFFTADSVHKLVDDTGYVALRWRRTMLPIGTTEVAVADPNIDTAVLSMLAADPNATTYQFIGVLADAANSPTMRELAQRADALQTELASREADLARLAVEHRGFVDTAERERIEAAAVAERERSEALATAERERSRAAQLDVHRNQLAAEVGELRGKLDRVVSRLNTTEAELHRATIAAALDDAELASLRGERDRFQRSEGAVQRADVLQAELDRLHDSETVKIGRLILKPVVLIKRMFKKMIR